MFGEALQTSLFSWTASDGSTQTLDVDVVMAAVDRRTAKMTDHVVETGATITDHVVVQPEMLSLDLLVTQTPIQPGDGMRAGTLSLEASTQRSQAKTYPLEIPPNNFQPGGFLLISQGVRSVISAGINLITGAAGGGPQMAGSDYTVEAGTIQAANVLQADSPTDRVAAVHDRLVEILTGALLVTVSFKGVLYVDYILTQVELTQAAGHGRFKVEARALRTVTGTTAALPSPADFRAKASVKKGAKPTKTPDPDPTKKATSWAKRAVNAAAGTAIGQSFNSLFGYGQ